MSDDDDSDLEVRSEGCNQKNARPTKARIFSEIKTEMPKPLVIYKSNPLAI